MKLDLQRFYKACNPSMTLSMENAEDRKYYIDFSSVRGGNIIRELGRTITRLSPDKPTCQLFTGHIGCGKSTELFRLQTDLEQQGFHVVYFDSSTDLVMGDVDVTDILLAIARQVSESLEQAKVYLQPRGFKALLQGVTQLMQTEIDLSAEASVPGLAEIKASTEGELSIGFGLGKISAKAKNSPKFRSQLRQYLEPRTDGILDTINQELLEPAIAQLKRQGKTGLVVIVDSLDRIDNSPKTTGHLQPEYLFVDRGEQLKQLNCHVVYTIPLVLIFSNDWGRLRNRFGVDPKLLPMVRVRSRDGSECEEGLALLRQMVLARAFPEAAPQHRLNLITEVFDSPETLDRLCRVSGGHPRNLLSLFYGCLQQQDPPFPRDCLEDIIRRQRDALIRAIDDQEWELLRQVGQKRMVRGEQEYQTLIRSMFVFEYQDEEGGWFRINPLLAETNQLKDEV
ncbi:ATP-binding protein [Allocoleopsis sp.]|uniref:ATP-binding protein n=1 Tax=Allocoleopsis sp. TaxID=3088169 RepID=UPI002FD5C8B5